MLLADYDTPGKLRVWDTTTKEIYSGKLSCA